MDVVTGKKALLYVDSPRWEFRFLNELLKSNEKIQADVILLSPGRALGGAEFRKALSDPKPLAKYRMVIIGEAAPYMTAREKESIAEYVRDGGQVVALGGRRSMFSAGGEWGAILGSKSETVKGGRDGFEVTPTERGWNNPLLRLEEKPEENMSVWRDLPFAQTFHETTPGPAAEILATHPWMKCGQKFCPAIFIENFGKGRALAFTFEGLCRWNFREKNQKYYDTLWKNILDDFMESRRSEPLSLTLNSRGITLGDSVTAALRAAPGVLEKGESPLLEVINPGGGAVKMTMARPEGGEEGFFTAVFTPGEIGRWSFKAHSARTASEPKPLAVSVSPTEFSRISMNADFLTRLAKNNNGIFTPDGGEDKIIKEIKNGARYRIVTKRFNPWSYPLAPLFITLLLTAEWLARRRGGLT